MKSLFYLKLLLWVVLLSLCLLMTHRKTKVADKFRALRSRIQSRFNRHIRLNDSFADDLENGLHSSNFDIISENSNDVRGGLDDVSKNEIKQIMENDNVDFDKARLLYMERKFGQNGIAPDGTPIDPKAFTFDSR
ncbi:ANM_HP_G0035170.mRNA.1.CDS.1 [Saccharomyces cerevisiae]|nr:ANM_HP_G0224000.mRNA.1.CDS.1 [Saccharomyces cerevisiae]CAI5219843.1 ANM_HP_G0035170.mRNA.1.CDS.1 [Saccharomyces cerevisiae]CAI6984649.1 ANM_HP_G0224000.mRNA.1.CDS.1 [Saccharomyces cerevisiae]CAI7025362.1 ANM_HP_G0035170.mRNA.1.CDS.1 [Saccharomyces cerevisiae]